MTTYFQSHFASKLIQVHQLSMTCLFRVNHFEAHTSVCALSYLKEKKKRGKIAQSLGSASQNDLARSEKSIKF